ncbi:SusC/RagA family TonB-linked outer membrane protein [Pedobacter yulinensis]|uniref:SusC/RagA family TonB-linked outer membrane protein n=1 Tax=Pedobacter yulinensis TaxID=2126353 RepID=A0A2T3HGW3_9SPHI|nr:TonB-dependent receptor [Pedobacter yulinensis]PST81662.1 SusC/RagA family TonB-linked outer membrane protein [Pedobacter yulinensis]
MRNTNATGWGIPLFLLLLCLVGLQPAVFGQQKSISGKVTNGRNEALPGVTVLSKSNKQNGTVTDAGGNFKINASPGEVLVFTFVGFKTKEVPVGSESGLTVTLDEETGNLQDVVVVGYGTQKKAVVSGAIASVKGEELTKSPTMNLSNSLGGRMAGITAVQSSGQPGYDGSAIRIRGVNSLGNSDALIVIDGVPNRAGGLQRLNPADVESVSVLKDASAAIYGSRAANGVILITTRQGKTGKPRVSYDYNYGWQQPTRTPEMSDARQYAEIRNELAIFDNLPSSLWSAANQAFKTSGSYTRPDNGSTVSAVFNAEALNKFSNGSDPLRYPNTDWFATTLKNWSPQQRHVLQVNGGSENVKYLASLGYLDQDGYYRNSATGYKQYDLRINLEAKVNEYITARLGLTGREEGRDFPTVAASDIFRMLMRGKPTEIEVWPDGRPGPDIEYGQNPYVITTGLTGYDRDTRDYLQTNGTVELRIPGVEGLKFTGMAALDKFFGKNKTWQTPWTLYSWDKQSFEADGVTPVLTGTVRSPFVDSRLTERSSDQLDINLTGMVNYDRTFKDHTLNLMAGVQSERVTGSGFAAFRRYFVSSAIDQFLAGGPLEQNIGNVDLNTINNNGDPNALLFKRARLSYYGRAGYNYKEKYLAEFLWRVDGSYIFPPKSRFGFFPGVSAGWRISEEPFFKDNIKWVSNLKIRASFGQMGAEAYLPGGTTLAEYQFLSTLGFGSYIFGDQQTQSLFESRLANGEFTWERASNTNVGFDAGLFDNKLSMEFDYFYNQRDNILIPRSGSIPGSSGITNKLPPVNLGRVNNKGFDFKVSYADKIGELSFNVSLNGGYSRNKILFWDETPGAPVWQQSTGMPINTFLVYDYDGVFVSQADVDANRLDYSAITATLRPGDMRFRDVNGDGKINGDDQIRLDKSNIPTLTGGLNINLGWKGFDATLLLQGAAGGLQYMGLTESGDIGNFLRWSYDNRWTIDNPSATEPRLANRGNTYYTNMSIAGNNTYWARSNNYLRLKNVEIGYTLPGKFGEKIGINNLRIFVSGLNLITFDKMKIWDPESTSSNGQYYPQARIINTGLSLGF